MNPESDPLVRVRPFWRILPAAQAADFPSEAGSVDLLLHPGEGWGTGAHETTQLCLQALALFSPWRSGRGWRMLDFGSGSGLLSIGAARLGATVDAVEIDEKGIEHGEKNASLNGVGDRLRTSRDLKEAIGPFDVVMANILRPILLGFADGLTERLVPGGVLVLSGLVATDVPEVQVHYASRLQGRQPQVYQRGEWRALVWSAGSGGSS